MHKRTSASLFYAFKMAYEGKFMRFAPARNAKDTAVLSRLIKEQGYEDSERYIKWVMNNWDAIKLALRRLQGYPSIAVMWGFRQTLFEMMDTPKKNSVKYDKGVKQKVTRINHNELFLNS